MPPQLFRHQSHHHWTHATKHTRRTPSYYGHRRFRTHATPTPSRAPCFRLFSEVYFMEGSECHDEAVSTTAAPAHHDRRSCLAESGVSVLVGGRRNEDPQWRTGEANTTHSGSWVAAQSPSDKGAAPPCMDANAPKRKRSWKLRRILVGIF